MAEGGEFEFIERLRRRVPTGDEAVGIGDDTAVLADGTLAAVDTLVEGRHVRLDWATPESIGWKAIVVNLSDIAAMGGRPTAALAAVTLTTGQPDLADRLATGLVEAAETYDCPLVGGDTTSGPTLVLSITVLGRTDPGLEPVLRRGARPGDAVFVTGPIGAAAQAYTMLAAGEVPSERDATALHRPVPRLAEGRAAARAGATAMIDVSDGLGADLGHVLDASGVGVEVDREAVPVAEGVDLSLALGGGDDYELCFTAADPQAVLGAFADDGLEAPVRIGTITDAADRVLRTADGVEPWPTGGWAHDVS